MNKAIVALGFLCICVGVFLWVYWIRYNWYGFTYIDYPYRDYGFILSIIGVIVIVVGLALTKKQPTQKTKQIEIIQKPVVEKKKERFAIKINKYVIIILVLIVIIPIIVIPIHTISSAEVNFESLTMHEPTGLSEMDFDLIFSVKNNGVSSLSLSEPEISLIVNNITIDKNIIDRITIGSLSIFSVNSTFTSSISEAQGLYGLDEIEVRVILDSEASSLWYSKSIRVEDVEIRQKK